MFYSHLSTPKQWFCTFALGYIILLGSSVPALAQEKQDLPLDTYYRPTLTGSWLTTYDVPVFFVPTPFGGSNGNVIFSATGKVTGHRIEVEEQ